MATTGNHVDESASFDRFLAMKTPMGIAASPSKLIAALGSVTPAARSPARSTATASATPSPMGAFSPSGYKIGSVQRQFVRDQLLPPLHAPLVRHSSRTGIDALVDVEAQRRRELQRRWNEAFASIETRRVHQRSALAGAAENARRAVVHLEFAEAEARQSLERAQRQRFGRLEAADARERLEAREREAALMQLVQRRQNAGGTASTHEAALRRQAFDEARTARLALLSRSAKDDDAFDTMDLTAVTTGEALSFTRGSFARASSAALIADSTSASHADKPAHSTPPRKKSATINAGGAMGSILDGTTTNLSRRALAMRRHRIITGEAQRAEARAALQGEEDVLRAMRALVAEREKRRARALATTTSPIAVLRVNNASPAVAAVGGSWLSTPPPKMASSLGNRTASTGAVPFRAGPLSVASVMHAAGGNPEICYNDVGPELSGPLSSDHDNGSGGISPGALRAGTPSGMLTPQSTLVVASPDEALRSSSRRGSSRRPSARVGGAGRVVFAEALPGAASADGAAGNTTPPAHGVQGTPQRHKETAGVDDPTDSDEEQERRQRLALAAEIQLVVSLPEDEVLAREDARPPRSLFTVLREVRKDWSHAAPPLSVSPRGDEHVPLNDATAASLAAIHDRSDVADAQGSALESGEIRSVSPSSPGRSLSPSPAASPVSATPRTSRYSSRPTSGEQLNTTVRSQIVPLVRTPVDPASLAPGVSPTDLLWVKPEDDDKSPLRRLRLDREERRRQAALEAVAAKDREREARREEERARRLERLEERMRRRKRNAPPPSPPPPPQDPNVPPPGFMAVHTPTGVVFVPASALEKSSASIGARHVGAPSPLNIAPGGVTASFSTVGSPTAAQQPRVIEVNLQSASVISGDPPLHSSGSHAHGSRAPTSQKWRRSSKMAILPTGVDLLSSGSAAALHGGASGSADPLSPTLSLGSATAKPGAIMSNPLATTALGPSGATSPVLHNQPFPSGGVGGTTSAMDDARAAWIAERRSEAQQQQKAAAEASAVDGAATSSSDTEAEHEFDAALEADVERGARRGVVALLAVDAVRKQEEQNARRRSSLMSAASASAPQSPAARRQSVETADRDAWRRRASTLTAVPTATAPGEVVAGNVLAERVGKRARAGKVSKRGASGCSARSLSSGPNAHRHDDSADVVDWGASNAGSGVIQRGLPARSVLHRVLQTPVASQPGSPHAAVGVSPTPVATSPTSALANHVATLFSSGSAAGSTYPPPPRPASLVRESGGTPPLAPGSPMRLGSAVVAASVSAGGTAGAPNASVLQLMEGGYGGPRSPLCPAAHAGAQFGAARTQPQMAGDPTATARDNRRRDAAAVYVAAAVRREADTATALSPLARFYADAAAAQQTRQSPAPKTRRSGASPSVQPRAMDRRVLAAVELAARSGPTDHMRLGRGAARRGDAAKPEPDRSHLVAGSSGASPDASEHRRIYLLTPGTSGEPPLFTGTGLTLV